MSETWHHDKVAVVTGAAKGIGFAIADRLARDGANLVIADLDAAGLEIAAKRLEETHGRRVETVAGNLALEPVATATIDRNLWTAIWCSWRAAPKMRAAGFGRIINIGADSVRNGLWDHAAYNAAKGGVHGLTTGMAREFARDGVTVNTVAPCAVNTPQMQAIVETDPALAVKFVGVIPMGRPAEMEEVASMVSYLASAEAAFVTGQVISVNGGSTML